MGEEGGGGGGMITLATLCFTSLHAQIGVVMQWMVVAALLKLMENTMASPMASLWRKVSSYTVLAP